jgi:hypothetical protein
MDVIVKGGKVQFPLFKIKKKIYQFIIEFILDFIGFFIIIKN